MTRHATAILLALALGVAAPSRAGSIQPREGWEVHDTDLAQAELFERLKTAVEQQGLMVVTRAGPTQAARNRGIEIPGNMVVGVYNNDYAVRVLELSVPAMIEAPIRFYLTEDEDGTATLSYKRPSHVFAPYMEEGGDALAAIAEELDGKFAEIAAAAVQP